MSVLLFDKKARRILLLCCLLAILIPLFIFVIKFWNQSVSSEVRDWADFGTFVGSTIQIILSVINIYIFFLLTEMAARISRNGLGKQLIQNSFGIYQQSINQMSLDFLSCLEQYNLTSDSSKQVMFMERIKNRLAWMQAITSSFISETGPILRNDDLDKINTSYSELSETIGQLMRTDLNETDGLKDFLEKKSLFMKSINEIIYSYYEEG